MKAYIVIAKMLMDQPGYDMLSRMLLHLGKSLLKVNAAVNCGSLRKRFSAIMEDALIFFLNIFHNNPFQRP